MRLLSMTRNHAWSGLVYTSPKQEISTSKTHQVQILEICNLGFAHDRTQWDPIHMSVSPERPTLSGPGASRVGPRLPCCVPGAGPRSHRPLGPSRPLPYSHGKPPQGETPNFVRNTRAPTMEHAVLRRRAPIANRLLEHFQHFTYEANDVTLKRGTASTPVAP